MVRSCALAFLLFTASPGFSAEEVAGRPTEEQAKVEPRAKLSLAGKNLSIRDLAIEAHARGGVKAHLDGRFRHALVLVIAPDGSKSIECVDSPEREAELLGVKPPAPEQE